MNRPNPKTNPEEWKTYWKEQIELAQNLLAYKINGVEHNRVAFGREESERYTGHEPCRDCACNVGQLHVAGCCMERCPVCEGQAISCRCNYAPNQAISEERACCAKKFQEVMATYKPMPIIPTPDTRWW